MLRIEERSNQEILWNKHYRPDTRKINRFQINIGKVGAETSSFTEHIILLTDDAHN